MDHRTCPKCFDDDEVRHVSTRDLVMTFRCRRCEKEWSVRLGPEPRPRFDVVEQQRAA